MILEFVLVALSLSFVHLSGVYLRYLAFRDDLPAADTRRLWQFLIILALLFIPLYTWIFSRTGIVVTTYKSTLFWGWIPFQAVFMLSLPNRILHHIFIFGMSVLWTFTIHSINTITTALFMVGAEEATVLLFYSVMFIVWYLLFLPLARHCFTSLLPAYSHFTRPAVQIYTSFLPIVMVTGYLVLINDDQLWHSWEERIARLLLPIGFFLAYHYILNASNRIYEQEQLQHNADIMKQEITYLEESRLLAADSREKIKKQQENLLKTYAELKILLQQGDIAGAQTYITQQEQILPAAAIDSYTDYAIINAAISIYLHRAVALGITIIHKTNLPRNMGTDENDLAVLLANLLENALLASAKETGVKQITLILQHNGSQCVLEMANTCHTTLQLADDGLPKTSRSGHGLGMLSLKNFLTKYDGYADFSQENGWVRLSMYWEDKPLC